MANSTADGSVVIDVNMDVSQAEKRLGKLRSDIKKTEKEIADMTAAKEEAKQKSLFQAAELDAEKAKLQEIKDRLEEIRNLSKDKSISVDKREAYAAQISAVKQEYDEQKTRVRALESEWNKTENAVDSYNKKIAASNQKLDDLKTEAGVLTQEIDEAIRKQNGFAKASAAAEKSMHRLGGRIMELAKSAFIFNVISRALTAIQQLTMKYIKTNDEARQAIAQMKGALLTLAQPLIEVIIPAFVTLVNILTKIIAMAAQLVSALFGKTVKQSKDGAKALYNEANAIGAVGEAADEAAGSLAGFDEINSIQTENAKGAGAGGGAAGGEIAPDFDFASGKYKDMIDELMVYLSGALLVIGAILLFSGANIPLGLGLMVLGAAILAGEIAENWGAVDGKVRDAVNRMLIILGGALLVIGAILCFTGANIPLGIGLMVVGAAMLAAAVALNWGTMGEELKNSLLTLLQIIGPLIAIIGVILAVSGHLLLGIGLIVVGIALFEVGNAGKEDGDFVENIRSRLTEALGIIGSLIAVVGLILLVTGHILLGLGLIIAGIALFEYSKVADDDGKTMQEKIVTALKETAEAIGPIIAIVGLFLLATGHVLPGLMLLIGGIALFEYAKVSDDNGKTIEEKITTVLKETAKIAGTFLLVLGLILLFVPGSLPLALGLIATGAIGIVAGISPDWGFIQKKFGEIWKDLQTWWDQNVSKYLTADWWKKKGIEVIDGLLEGLKNAWDGLTSWFSGVWDKLFGNRKVSVDVDAKSSAGNYNSSPRVSSRSIPEIAAYNIPALARGAVIPPNREFLAVLGDQRSGTNIEAPLETIKQALAEVMQSNGSGGDIVINVTTTLDGRVVARNTVHHINDMTRQAGKPVLLL